MTDPTFDELRAKWRQSFDAMTTDELGTELARLAVKVESGEPTGTRDADLLLEAGIRLGTAEHRRPGLPPVVGVAGPVGLVRRFDTPSQLRAAIAAGESRDAAELEDLET